MIAEFPHPDPERPVEGAIEGIYRLLQAGWYIEIYSGGSKYPERLEAMKALLNTWSQEYLSELGLDTRAGLLEDAETAERINFAIGKPTAKIYVDDRGMRFIGWHDLTPMKLEAFRAWWQHPASEK